MNTPKVSVLMPVYNTREDYLREAIESILEQTYTDFEFIIVNDGSINNVRDIVLSYEDKRIHYSENDENLGIVSTRNKMVELSRGEYIAVMDHDDISLPHRLGHQVDALDKFLSIGVVGSWYKEIPSGKECHLPIHDRDIKHTLIFIECALAHSSVMMRKSLAPRYDDRYTYAEDYALWVDLIKKTMFYNIPEILLHYRWHDTNVSIVHADVQRMNANCITQRAQVFYSEQK